MLLVFWAVLASHQAPATPPSAREALQPFQSLVGSWRCSGHPEGTREERQAGLWTETAQWGWRFNGQDAWLAVTFEKGKYYTSGELRYLPAQSVYQLRLRAPDQTLHTFAGPLKERVLTLDRVGGPAGERQRLVFSLLHPNRHLYRFESGAGPGGLVRRWQVGATKEGEAFADVPRGPECVVSGGLGTIRVAHNGKDYWVCCSGCRDEFRADPEKYVREAAAKAKK